MRALVLGYSDAADEHPHRRPVDGHAPQGLGGELQQYRRFTLRAGRHRDLLRDSKLRGVAQAAHSQIRFESDYPEWAFCADSPLLNKAIAVYEKKYGEKPRVMSVHAGLECGFFRALYPDMEIISIGPNLVGAHTPSEKLDVASAGRVYEWLTGLIAALKD